MENRGKCAETLLVGWKKAECPAPPPIVQRNQSSHARDEHGTNPSVKGSSLGFCSTTAAGCHNASEDRTTGQNTCGAPVAGHYFI
ncbi:hypothetical protein WJX73_003848 [Symbiochloris irregularis]|uniref:Uncharacterized protein n=1 Tax=Symbiochloris irregularis TaxID=706552 RepID=A0AAW1NRA0_9CHLO